ncbi:hypothetical protein KFY46_25725, partial [Salmonella enterica subsp. enterica serovar 1,4,[5],12:i:-]|nr:hypothetical protein [Salmonella enterica subsp. enterica serovar 1,4,[5],12:i:-]
LPLRGGRPHVPPLPVPTDGTTRIRHQRAAPAARRTASRHRRLPHRNTVARTTTFPLAVARPLHVTAPPGVHWPKPGPVA